VYFAPEWTRWGVRGCSDYLAIIANAVILPLLERRATPYGTEG